MTNTDNMTIQEALGVIRATLRKKWEKKNKCELRFESEDDFVDVAIPVVVGHLWWEMIDANEMLLSIVRLRPDTIEIKHKGAFFYHWTAFKEETIKKIAAVILRSRTRTI